MTCSLISDPFQSRILRLSPRAFTPRQLTVRLPAYSGCKEMPIAQWQAPLLQPLYACDMMHMVSNILKPCRAAGQEQGTCFYNSCLHQVQDKTYKNYSCKSPAALTGATSRGEDPEVIAYRSATIQGTAWILPVVGTPLHLQGVAHVYGERFELPFGCSRSPASHRLDASCCQILLMRCFCMWQA